MASVARQVWEGESQARLEELLRAHETLSGSGPGRKWGVEQVNRGLIVTLVAEFQRFSLHLYTEAMAVVVAQTPPPLRAVVQPLLANGLKLEHNTPRPSHLGSDFGRLQIPIVKLVKDQGMRASQAMSDLDRLADLRNAISHANEGELQRLRQGGLPTTKRTFTQMRSRTGLLARVMDEEAARALHESLGVARPW